MSRDSAWVARPQTRTDNVSILHAVYMLGCMDLFHYLPEHRVFVCFGNRYAVPSTNLCGHTEAYHRHESGFKDPRQGYNAVQQQLSFHLLDPAREQEVYQVKIGNFCKRARTSF